MSDPLNDWYYHNMIALLKYISGAFLLILNFSLHAAWQINTSGQKGIYIINNKHQLSIIENNNSVDFFLSLPVSKAVFRPERVIMQVGELNYKTGKVKLVNKHHDQQTFLLSLSKKQKTSLLNKMISGLEITVNLAHKRQPVTPIIFSLSGFTARLNDFLIAKEIGKLDYEWLLENHKDRELLCYYAANIYVKALLDRLNKKDYKYTMNSIVKTGIDKLDNATGEMIQNVYSIPARKLPTDPRGDKYGIFKACMSQAN